MAAFYIEVIGMVRHPDGPGSEVRVGWGLGHHVLEFTAGRPAFVHLGMEILDAGGATAVAEQMRVAGVEVDSLPSWPGAFVVRDPDGNCLHLHGPIDRSGEFTADSRRRPVRLQHVTFATTGLAEMVDFYRQLGMTISDRMETQFYWLRSSAEHHSIAIVQTERCALDHYCFDLAAWEDFKAWSDRLSQLRVMVTWGPGRHGPGNNLFLFLDDPDGTHIELSAEMEIFWDTQAASEARVWKAEPETINLWGGQLARWRSTESADASRNQ
jgi:catechol 2,3-dioxygenase